MNSLNFLQRLQPSLATQDITTLTANDRLDLVDAINLALGDWAEAAPASLRTFPGTASFPAPQSITLTCTANSQVISGGGLTAADVGKTLVIAGDAVPHTLTSPTTLRLVYAGTTGSQAATLYGEACPLPASFESLASPVWHEDTLERRALPALQDIRRVRWFSGGAIPSLGDPLGYGIEVGNTLGGIAAPAVMRLYPVPATLQRLSFDWTGRPQSWTMTDLIKPRDLDLSDDHWTTIKTLVLARLLSTALLRTELNGAQIQTQAERALSSLRHTRSTPHSRPLTIETPEGW